MTSRFTSSVLILGVVTLAQDRPKNIAAYLSQHSRVSAVDAISSAVGRRVSWQEIVYWTGGKEAGEPYAIFDRPVLRRTVDVYYVSRDLWRISVEEVQFGQLSTTDVARRGRRLWHARNRVVTYEKEVEGKAMGEQWLEFRLLNANYHATGCLHFANIYELKWSPVEMGVDGLSWTARASSKDKVLRYEGSVDGDSTYVTNVTYEKSDVPGAFGMRFAISDWNVRETGLVAETVTCFARDGRVLEKRQLKAWSQADTKVIDRMASLPVLGTGDPLHGNDAWAQIIDKTGDVPMLSGFENGEVTSEAVTMTSDEIRRQSLVMRIVGWILASCAVASVVFSRKHYLAKCMSNKQRM